MEINFEKGLESKDEARKVVQQIKGVIEDLTNAAKESKEAAIAANKNAEDFRQALEVSSTTNINLSDAIKAIYLTLNKYTEIIDQADELAELRTSLAKLMLDSGMIKLGVMSHEQSK